MDDLLTISEAAAELGFHPNTIRKFIKTGRLPAYRIGVKIIRIKRSDLETIFNKVGSENV